MTPGRSGFNPSTTLATEYLIQPPPQTMAMVNNLVNVKDSRWLQLEVCREFQRNKCTRPDTECKFAHPPANVEVQNGRVTACYDSIKFGLIRQEDKRKTRVNDIDR
uniref:C3H1-type domain-containing protein n=1 Tax=Strigamia maritima TaxID=126957 RepID=T1JNS4_STRMM